MTSIIAPPPSTTPSRLAVSRTKPSASSNGHHTSVPKTIQEPTPPHAKLEEEHARERGRPRSRSHGSHDLKEGSISDTHGDDQQDADNADNGDGGDGDNSSNSDGPARKRRRSRKGLDKKFECPHAGCGKSYSRAEHLHRHQLNHTPKQIYMCDFPGCERHFVRLDLCNRHRDRHTAKGSSLNRKDPLLPGGGPGNPSTDNPGPPRTPFVNTHTQGPGVAPASDSPESLRPRRSAVGPGHKIQTSGFPAGGPLDMSNSANSAMYSPSAMSAKMPFSPVAGTPGGYNNGFPSSNGGEYTHTAHSQHQDSMYGSHAGQNSSTLQQLRPPYQSPAPQQPQRSGVQPNGMYNAMSPTINNHNGHSAVQSPPVATQQHSVFVATQHFPAFDLPPSNFVATNNSAAASTPQTPAAVPRSDSMAAATTGGDTNMAYMSSTDPANDYDTLPGQSGTEMSMLDQMSMLNNTMPMFGADMLQKSPQVGLPEDFMRYLFNSTPQEGSPMVGYQSTYGDFQNSYNVAYPGNDLSQAGYFPAPTQQVMSVTSLVDQDLPESSFLSDEKSQELFELIKERFHENGHTPIERRNESITDGDRSLDTHMLSRNMMQAYIVSYWVNFSDQIPILHKPTFSPDRAPNLLLIAIMTIGAACLDKTHGQDIIKAGADLSNFLAWHLRWELFMDSNFRPPAKLWVFQTLLLLELYEKMYSTRELHERAHIHHATTITLMRRGRSLIGKTSAESPPDGRTGDGSNHHHESANKDRSSRHSSTSGGASHTQDHWWNNWITNEATRRTAFAAFVIDSIHCTMFGHSAVMVAHEMRLPLPCDDRLWKATSGIEVTRAEAQLMSEGIKPIVFLEGIKKTLSGAEVKTNAFGRTILMAGLLSVAWHMHQRDLQVNSLGGSQGLGGRDKWRSTLNRAFDSWKGDYDKSLQRIDTASGKVMDPYAYDGGEHNTGNNGVNVVFESRVVLHHLAHMATHVDVVDLQIYARAKRLLGRPIGTADQATVRRRMKDVWAPTAKARDATFYAIQFLCSVLLRNEGNSPIPLQQQILTQQSSEGTQSDDVTYSARDDVLLNRPWVLYFAALVVWSYGYALEGPCPQTPVPQTWPEQVQEMREYLHKFGSISSPEDLKAQRGLNQNSALLLVLKSTFSRARWELLHEGATLLGNCIQLNMGTIQ
ncbi:hypothetical protein SBRCBS47491_008941 [Sporothrix bragantina]|uniref:C2H2-type domain-containing protein n=1 Tax=Sporothrix bragantina TaxID=671064 RepID=A0ABP0CR94_9PEZI